MSIRLFRNAFRDLFRFRLGPPAMNPSLQIAGMPQTMLEDLDYDDDDETSDSFWFAAPKRKVCLLLHHYTILYTRPLILFFFKYRFQDHEEE